jgi:hypothetical protein
VRSHRRDRTRPVDDPDADLVGADNTRIDERVGAGAGGGVQGIHQVLDRRVLGTRVVVLKLHEADDVGVERGDGADDLVSLAAKLKGSASTARRREPTTSAVATSGDAASPEGRLGQEGETVGVGHNLATITALSDRREGRLRCSEECPRQESNLRPAV